MIKMFLKGITAASFILLANVAAPDFYLGGGLYKTSLDVGDFSDDDQAMSVFVGWEPPVIPFVSVEAAYHDLGSYSDNDVSAYSAQAVLTLPVMFFDFYAKLGVAKTDVDGASESDSSNDPYYAAGVAFTLLPVVDIYAEYQQFDFSDDVKIGAYGLGAKINF